MQGLLPCFELSKLGSEELTLKHSILIKGLLAPSERLRHLGMTCTPTKYSMRSGLMEFRARFRNGRELIAKSEQHLNSDEFYAACLMIYDLPPEGR